MKKTSDEVPSTLQLVTEDTNLQGVSGFSGMGIVEWWNGNGGMDFFLIHFVCLFVYSMDWF